MAKTPPKKKEAPVKKATAKKEAPETEKEGFRGIVRIAGKDIKGRVPLERGLLRVRGIGHSLAVSVTNVLAKELKIKKDIKVGELTDEQIEKIDAILFNLQQHGIPRFLLNRSTDKAEGRYKHVIMNDLLFALREDVETEKKNYSWRGYRHAYGQKVRGQKTRNTGRKGMAVGVLRKSVIAAQKGGPAKSEGKEKK